jgi:hypothetical protein
LATINGSSDSLVVYSVEFRELLLEEFGDDPSWIYHIAKMLELDYRTIYGKLYRQKTVSYSIADKWLTGLGMPGQINYLTAIPNPRWSQERWIKYMEERGCV